MPQSVQDLLAFLCLGFFIVSGTVTLVAVSLVRRLAAGRRAQRDAAAHLLDGYAPEVAEVPAESEGGALEPEDLEAEMRRLVERAARKKKKKAARQEAPERSPARDRGTAPLAALDALPPLDGLPPTNPLPALAASPPLSPRSPE
jgi:hypothetical protein